MRDVVAVIGNGKLAEMTVSLMAGRCRVIRRKAGNRSLPKKVNVALVLHDDWRPSDYAEAEDSLRRAGIPWLGGFVLSGEGVIGPCVRPDAPGCSQCAEIRRLTAGRDREDSMQQQMDLLMTGAVSPGQSVSPFGLRQLSVLIAAEADRILQGRPVHTDRRVYFVDLLTLNGSLHCFLPDSLCPVCSGRLPVDSPDNARIALRPNLKIDPDTYRCRPMDELERVLAHDYLDDRLGMMTKQVQDSWSPFADMLVNLPSTTGNETAAGRSHSYARSLHTALLEGVERYCGMLPRGKQTAVHESYRDVADQALDPLTVGVYSAEQHAQADFPLEPFDPDRPIDWVWGYSFLEERPILVPQQLAYYSMGLGDGFVLETSNGNALGGSLEEAILYGVLEAAERDAFLMTWYARLPVPRLDPYSAGDPELRLMLDRIRAVAGYELLLFNSTMEYGIPSVWAIAKNRKRTGANLVCGAGAHPDPVQAAKSAIFELAGSVMYLDYMYDTNHEAYREMIDDSSRVEQMEHHSLLYTVPEAEERLRFLLAPDRPLRTFAEEFPQRQRYADLTDDLHDVLGRFRKLNRDVIVIDQTAPETMRNGLFCVKTLVPGLLPMTFGQHLKRLTGMDRVFQVPMQLGFVARPLTPGELNPYPHPFL